jgi:predicted DNA-binding transcriptional regulator YafY
LIVWCRLRNGFRDFRCDRIKELKKSSEVFEPRKIYTMHEYFNSLQNANIEVKGAIVLFGKKEASMVNNSKHYFGFVSQEEEDGQIRMRFLLAEYSMMAQWLLAYGSGIQIESPQELKSLVIDLVGELQDHYLKLV